MNNIIPISLLTKKMQFFRGKKLDDDCPICLLPMYSKKVKKLVCNHVLHTNCYQSLISSNCNKKCPVCRCDLSAPAAPISHGKTCAICKTPIDNQEVKIHECSCRTHYTCIRKMRKHNEEKYCNCGRIINPHNIDLLDYTNLSEVFSLVIGEMPPCKEKTTGLFKTWGDKGGTVVPRSPTCKNLGSPNRYGFCEDHSQDQVPDAIFALALQFMVRYSRKENKKERRSLFYRVMIILESYKFTSHHTIEDAVEKLKYHI